MKCPFKKYPVWLPCSLVSLSWGQTESLSKGLLNSCHAHTPLGYSNLICMPAQFCLR